MHGEFIQFKGGNVVEKIHRNVKNAKRIAFDLQREGKEKIHKLIKT